MSRTLLFRREFQFYTGGHGKVRDYFDHAAAHPGWSPMIHLVPGSSETDNPWRDVQGQVTEWSPGNADALFLAGMDWTALGHDSTDRPVINLVQHVRHADPDQPLHGFLSRRAIRICVSQAVADAVHDTGRVNGPLFVIEAAASLLPVPRSADRRGIFIDALKQPSLGLALHQALSSAGHDVTVSTDRLLRSEYLGRLASCSVAVLLPHHEEGFYLPALEAMALGCAVVVPDCIGNRAYLEPSRNALAPEPRVDALLAAILQLDDPEQRLTLAEAGIATASRFTLERERRAFHQLLDALDSLWT